MTIRTLGEAVDLVSAGDEVYIGGFGYNQPFAAAHELIRRDVGDLRVARASGDVLLDQLVGAGLVAETVTSHCWNAIGPTPTHAFRRAVEDGEPRPLDVSEFGLGDLVMRFLAGARGLPFVPAAPAPGTGQFEHDGGAFEAVEVDGQTHHVLRPIAPDVGFVHVHRADERGNAQLRGPLAELPHAALACETLVVTAEAVVPEGTVRATPELTAVPAFAVDAVVEVPGGSHPSGVVGRYERDVPYLEHYGETTETTAGIEAYLDEWVHGVADRAGYLERVASEGFGEEASGARKAAPADESPAADPPTPREQLLYVAAREFDDESVAFTGFHWPVVAARVARRLHAPGLTSVFEAGIAYRGLAERLPTSTTEVGAFEGHADWYGNSLDTLRTALRSGRLDAAVVDAANVDRFGNVNSSVVGGYGDPDVRLPGPGGAKDILTYGSDVTLICGSTDPRRYQDRVEYVTSPGHLDGDGTRAAAGFPPGTGPGRLLTPLGRFVFDDSGRARLDALAREATVADVREVTGWDVPAGEYPRLPVPSGEALAVVREVLAEAGERGYRSVRP